MMLRGMSLVLRSAVLTLGVALAAGCAKHSDFVELRTDLTRLQDQSKKEKDALDRRLQALEAKLEVRPAARSGSAEAVREVEHLRAQLSELAVRVKELESRLARADVAAPPTAAKPAAPPAPGTREGKAAAPPSEPESLPLPGMTGITPTSAFNLAYNDYLNGRYELAIAGFERFLKDFPGNSLTPNAHYWIGESYYSKRDYVRAMQAFEKVVTGFPRSEKVPPALFKMGLSAAEIGDSQKARTLLKRVIEEFSGSDEAKLAKNKLAEIR